MRDANASHLDPAYRSALITSASLNATMLVAESVVGLWIGSAALLADAMDFAEDTGLYLFGVAAIRWSARDRAFAGLVTGLAMCAVGFLAATQIASRVYSGGAPVPLPMAAMATGALAVNLFCAYRLVPFRTGDLSMRAIWLSTRNDAILNAITILAASAVALTASAWPDLLAGGIIAAINVWAALNIIVRADREIRTRPKATKK